MIELCKVEKKIKKKFVLKDINLSFNIGEVVLLHGHNGSGKTMLLRTLCGLVRPDKGNVNINENIRFGVIIENPSFFQNETAFYNLKYLASIKKRINEDEIIKWLQVFNLYDVKDNKVKSFSLGMRQRLALCQAFMEDPDVLLLDEPFNGIDEENLKIIYNVLEKEKEKGKIIVIASHMDIPIRGLVDTQLKMSDGELINIQRNLSET